MVTSQVYVVHYRPRTRRGLELSKLKKTGAVDTGSKERTATEDHEQKDTTFSPEETAARVRAFEPKRRETRNHCSVACEAKVSVPDVDFCCGIAFHNFGARDFKFASFRCQAERAKARSWRTTTTKKRSPTPLP